MAHKFLLAFDKFKDSMTAHAATMRARQVIEKFCPDASIHEAPLTDGGEGFCAILTQAASGTLETQETCGPRFEALGAQIGFVDAERVPAESLASLNLPASVERIAVIEMAQAAGIQSVPVTARDARFCSSFGVGQQLLKAIEERADAILLGVGGSATSDLGLGALEALGFEFYDSQRIRVEKITPALFPEIAFIERPDTQETIPAIRIACDVNNPLLGPHGAAHVFGPQKGLTSEYIPQLDGEVDRLARLLCGACKADFSLVETPGAGAAGGIAAGLLIALGAELVSGFSLVRSWLRLETALQEADFLITGEGKWDASSLDGKGPFAVIDAVSDRAVDVLLVAGALDAEATLPLRDSLNGNLYTLELKDSEKSLQENLVEGPRRLSELMEVFFAEKSL